MLRSPVFLFLCSAADFRDLILTQTRCSSGVSEGTVQSAPITIPVFPHSSMMPLVNARISSSPPTLMSPPGCWSNPPITGLP